MKKLLKLIFINIFVFLAILILLNISAVLIFRGYKLVKSDSDPRSNLPNYKNITWAETHFKEFMDLPSVYTSYVGWRRQPFTGKTINIDERGIRFTKYPSSYSDSVTLVAFTGGSALWGTGSDDNNTIPSLFSENAGEKVKSINLGESGYNSFQGFLFLKLQLMSGLKPNVIISYDGANDIDVLNRQNRMFSHVRENQINNALKGLDRDEILSLKHYFIDPLIAFINKFRTKLYGNTSNDYDLSPERLDMAASVFLNSWQSIKDLADQNHAVFIGVLQPTIYTGNPRTDHLKIDKSLEPVYRAFYTVVLKKLKDPEYSELSKSVLDLGNMFDGDEYIYIDEVHVSPNGNRIAASKIYNFTMDIKRENKIE